MSLLNEYYEQPASNKENKTLLEKSLKIDGYEFTEENFNALVKKQLEEALEDNYITGVEITGIKAYELKENNINSIKVLVQYIGDTREDDLFNVLSECGLSIEGVKLDVNPIKPGKSGTIESYLAQLEMGNESEKESARYQHEPSLVKGKEIMNYDLTIGNESISFAELKLVNTGKYPYAVTMTDSFLSGWGDADKRKAKFIHLCTNLEMAEKMSQYANRRTDTKKVNIIKTSNIDKSFFTSARVCLKCPSELSAWTADYRKDKNGKDLSELQKELSSFDEKNNPFQKIEKLRRLCCIKNNYVFDRRDNAYVYPEGNPEKHPYCSKKFDLSEYKDYIEIVYASRLDNSDKLPSMKLAAKFAKQLYKNIDPKDLSKQMIAQGLKDEGSISDFFSTCEKEVLRNKGISKKICYNPLDKQVETESSEKKKQSKKTDREYERGINGR